MKKSASKATGSKGKSGAAKPAAKSSKGSEKSIVPKDIQGKSEILNGIKCSLRDMDKVLLKDEDGTIKKSGRWPLLIDLNGQAATFLRYRDTNYLCTANSSDMQPERLRLALIGAKKAGKAVVIDMLDTDMLGVIESTVDKIQPNLFKDLMSKEILKDDKFLQLERSEDPSQPDLHTEDFTFIIATTKESPPDDLLKLTFPVRVE